VETHFYVDSIAVYTFPKFTCTDTSYEISGYQISSAQGSIVGISGLGYVMEDPFDTSMMKFTVDTTL